jgi:CMP-N,N'-diacetyllegionaminic acid synthase
MMGDKSVIAVIPARGGSKSVPKKNIRLLGGQPLIVWSIETARKVKGVDRVMVSTDDEEIAVISRTNGAEVYRRPAHLATDEALVIDALRDLIATLRAEGEAAEIMVLLEPTCPFRSVEDITGCLELIAQGCDSAATFKEAELNPHRAWKINRQAPEVFVPGAIPWLPRQKLPPAYQLNGAVYAFRMDKLPKASPALLFGRQGALVMPRERSVDIDGPLDFLVAEAMVKETV